MCICSNGASTNSSAPILTVNYSLVKHTCQHTHITESLLLDTQFSNVPVWLQCIHPINSSTPTIRLSQQCVFSINAPVLTKKDFLRCTYSSSAPTWRYDKKSSNFRFAVIFSGAGGEDHSRLFSQGVWWEDGIVCAAKH